MIRIKHTLTSLALAASVLFASGTASAAKLSTSLDGEGVQIDVVVPGDAGVAENAGLIGIALAEIFKAAVGENSTNGQGGTTGGGGNNGSGNGTSSGCTVNVNNTGGGDVNVTVTVGNCGGTTNPA